MDTVKGTILTIGIGAALIASGVLALNGRTSAVTSEPPKSGEARTDKTTMLTWNTLNPEEKSPERKDKLVLTDAEWRKRLKPESYDILRSHGTEPAFCGILLDNPDHGVYHCGGCDLPLFSSGNKYKSGSGWPSFYLPLERKNVWFRTDKSYGMVRVEVLCARCDGHLGHVFPDGPEPSGIRFCINGKALNFKKDSEKK